MHTTERVKLRLYRFIIPVLFITMVPAIAAGQMFSIGTAGSERFTIPENSLYFGIEPASAHFYGNHEFGPGDVRYDFEGTIYRIRYETNSLQVYGATGSGLSEQNNINFRSLGIQLQGNLTLYTRPKIAWTIPLYVSTDYYMMRNDRSANTSSEFSQNRLMFGLGQELVMRPVQSFRLRLKAAARYGVSASSFGASVGTAFAFDQQVRVYFDRLLGPVGINAGFDYSYNRFMTAEDQFKYNLDSITFLIGISF